MSVADRPITTDIYGEEIELNARTGTSDGETPPAIENVRCVVTSPDERRVPFAMTSRHVVTPSGKSFPGYATEYTAQLPGLHKAMVTADINGEEIESDPISFFVKPFTPESVPRPSNTDVLRTLAQSSGGRFFRSITDLDAALASLQFASLEEERVKYLSLWRNFIMLTCLMGLLTLEWAVRKWRNMP